MYCRVTFLTRLRASPGPLRSLRWADARSHFLVPETAPIPFDTS